MPGNNVVGSVLSSTSAVSLVRPSITCNESLVLLMVELSRMFSMVKFTTTRMLGSTGSILDLGQ